MTTLFKTPFSTWIRGAQSTVHEARMFTQSIIHTIVFALFFIGLVALYMAWTAVDDQERYTLFKWTEAAFNVVAINNADAPVEYKDEAGKVWLVKSGAYYDAPMVKRAAKKVWRGALKGAVAGFGATAALVGALLGFFYVAGLDQSRSTFIRGARLSAAKTLNAALKKEGEPGSVEIGETNLPRAFETSHLLYLGAPGTGKTQLILKLLSGVRRDRGRAVVYDVAGAYVEAFYRPGKDVLLNPLDTRAPNWTVWQDARFQADYDQIADSLLPPEDTRDKFWAYAPQVLFRAVAKKLGETGDTTNEALLKRLTRGKLSELIAYCQDTEAASILDESGEKMTASVRATLTASLRGFTYLRDEGEPFSIRNWIESEDDDSWLFITTKNDQIAALRPLITMWVDIATSALLSLPPNADRRMWLVFDELTSLNRLPSLLNTLAQSRKYGGCAALSFQSFAQLQSVYGDKDAEAISGSCSTWTLLRANDVATAEWAAKALGQTEQSEANEGLSIGRHEMRDGRTIQKQRVTRPIVLPTELRNLKNLSCYLSVGRGYPITLERFAYEAFPAHEPAFLLKDEIGGAPLLQPDSPIFAEPRDPFFPPAPMVREEPPVETPKAKAAPRTRKKTKPAPPAEDDLGAPLFAGLRSDGGADGAKQD